MSSVKVNEEKCIGCGACVAIAPENFDFNDEGLSIVKGEDITEETVSAMEACPVCAIDISTDGCECGCDCNCGDDCECDCDDDCECDSCCGCGCGCDCEEENEEDDEEA